MAKGKKTKQVKYLPSMGITEMDFQDWSGTSSGWFKSSDTKATYGSCARSHPALILPGTQLVIYGGSCSTPVIKDADVYIGFSYGMQATDRQFPWTPGYEILMEVPDQGIPKSLSQYRHLLEWTKAQLEQGAKVHAGCVGGHGRTGMFLSALVSLFGEDDAIAYVRTHYCKKSVETKKQIDFLMKEYGVKPAAARYHASSRSSGKSSKATSFSLLTGSTLPGGAPTIIKPLAGGSIWGDKK